MDEILNDDLEIEYYANYYSIDYKNIESFKSAVNKLSKILCDKDVIYFLATYFHNEINNMVLSEKSKLEEFYGDKINQLKWFPAGLSIDMIFNIYIYMLSKGESEMKILKLLNEDINSCITIYKNLVHDKIALKYYYSEEFVSKIKNNIDVCNEKKSNTISFNRMIDCIESKNENLIRRLQ